MKEPLDSILAGGEAVSGDQREQGTQQQADGAAEGQQQTGQSAEADAGGDEGGGSGNVPIQALHAERAKVKRYTEEVADFRKALAETNAAFERRMGELVEAVKPKQPVQIPDQFEDGAGFVAHHARQQFGPAIDQIGQQLQNFAKDIAISRSSEAEVNEAEAAFLTALKAGTLDPADYQKVVGSPNRFAAATQWHRSQKAKAEIGDDPAAYRAKLEAEIREKVLAELNGGNGQQQAHQRQQGGQFPSNLAGARNTGARSGPAWSGPASLNDIFDRSRQTG